ncbi:MAG: UDP-glucose/GDP-mannose dehydrogenase family protein [Candidatus Margulisiibacteriota bacterium]|jgi:UDPglucose 6-dehydrogenase
MKICIIGTGYVGLVTGVCFADLGHSVICVDKDTHKIHNLKEGIPPFYEPGLKEIILKNMEAERITFTSNIKQAIEESNIIFIAVDTPALLDGAADISKVMAVADTIAQQKANQLKTQSHFFVVVNKSTVPVGTGELVKEMFFQKGLTDDNFAVLANPEFLREGSAISDSMKPDRIIIGSYSEKAIEMVEALYKPLFRIDLPIIRTNLETAELIKYAANSFLALKITFINEMANICDAIGADVHQIAKGIGSDGRIGRYFLHPGPGYGGACFPKDTRALVKIAEKANCETKIVKACIEANEAQKKVMIHKILNYYQGFIEKKTFAILGLSFKANTDDVRESPAINVINDLLKHNAIVQVFDPVAINNVKKIFGDRIKYKENIFDTLLNADALIILTEWNDFRYIEISKIKELLIAPVIFDARNLYDPKQLKDNGFVYFSIGRDNC